MKKTLLLISLCCVTLVFHSCMDDDLWQQRNRLNMPASKLEPGNTVLISNEGNFMYGNASVSYYNKRTHEVVNDVFFKQNGSPLGDVAQSIAYNNGLAYVVVNNSGKVYVMNMGKYPDLPAFEYTGKITGLTSPRYIHFLNDEKAYITDLYGKKITIFNPTTLQKRGSVDVNNHSQKFKQHPTEQIVQFGKYLFTNCWSYDNKILVIDTEKDQVVDSITVGLQPTSLVMDKYNKIWTITDGGYQGSPYGYEAPSLWKIDAASRKVEKTFHFNKGDRGSEVKLNGTRDTLYFINTDIWRMDVTSAKLPETPFILGKEKLFYGINIDPENSDVYAVDAIDYIQPGIVYRISSHGVPIDTLRVGIIPGEVNFY